MKKEFDSSERSLVSTLELRQPVGKLTYWLIFAGLLLLTLTTIFPLYWMYTGGLKTTVEMIRMPPGLIPEDPNWGNYARAWTVLDFTRYFLNTLGLAAGAWVLQMLVSTTAAYSLSRLKPAFGNIILFLFMGTLMVPPMAYLIPQYLTVVHVPILNISLLDTWWGVWLPQAASAFNIFVLKSFFDEIPADLTDAAKIDGANAAQVLQHIILPLSRPVLAVITIFTVIGTWKDFFWPYLVLMSNTNAQPIMVALYRLTSVQNTYPEPLNIIMAGLAIASTPPLILFLIFQKQILRGITLTGLKG